MSFGVQAYDREGCAIDLDRFTDLLCDPDYKIVARDEVGQALVSTVWLGIDHGWGRGRPVIFETMVFGDDVAPNGLRYYTEQQALEGHAELVVLLRATRADADNDETAGKSE